MLMQELQRQMRRPPVFVRHSTAGRVIEGALGFVRFVHFALLLAQWNEYIRVPGVAEFVLFNRYDRSHLSSPHCTPRQEKDCWFLGFAVRRTERPTWTGIRP